MPWELQAIPSDGDTLGSVRQVQAELRAAVPQIELFRDASGSEKLAAMAAQGIRVPDVIREHLLSSKGAHRGLVEGDRFTIELHLGEHEAGVVTVGIDVRGSGDPMLVIERLMKIPGWKVVDSRGDPPSLEAWISFGAWRDDAVGQIDEGV